MTFSRFLVYELVKVLRDLNLSVDVHYHIC
jgi:hypothetical protein